MIMVSLSGQLGRMERNQQDATMRMSMCGTNGDDMSMILGERRQYSLGMD